MSLPDELPRFERLTAEQDEVQFLPLNGNFLISGPPGTGKSVMAIHRAQALAIDDRTPVLLMYNRVLNSYTTSLIENLGPVGRVMTFHRWMHEFWTTTYGSRPPMSGNDDWAYDWTAVATRILTDPPPRDRDLVVDEGQDMPLGFYRLARWICRSVTVFADENQHLREVNTTLREIELAIGADRHLVLRHNHRNSREIAALASWFHCGLPTDVPELPTRRHQPGPRLHAYAGSAQFVTAVATYARRRPGARIGIAVHTLEQQERLVAGLVRHRMAVQTYASGSKKLSIDIMKPGVKVLTYMSIKGLQFDTLFVPGLDAVTEDVTSASLRMRYYVVLSRACNELELSYFGRGEPPIVAQIPHDLLRRTDLELLEAESSPC